jgi:cation diffusion facilitator family transporter
MYKTLGFKWLHEVFCPASAFVQRQTGTKPAIPNVLYMYPFFSSIGTALGITGAIILGESWRILDPIAGVIVSFFILKVAWDIAKPSIGELLDSSLPETTVNELEQIIAKIKGVEFFHNLRTRKMGEDISVEVHIKVDKNMTVEVSHQIATEIEITIRQRFGERAHLIVHVEPFLIN